MRHPRPVTRLAALAAAAAFVLVVSAVPAAADATVDEWSATCSNFAASGTVTAPYYVVQVWDDDEEVSPFHEAFPSADGTFDFDVPFEEVPEGTNLWLYVWGSPTDDPDDWDEEDYFEMEITCEAAPTPPTPPTPPAPPVDPGDDAAPADLVRATPRFTG